MIVNKRLFILGFIIIASLSSCKTQGVDKQEDGPSIQTEHEVAIDSLELDLPTVEAISLDNGMTISWLEKNNGDAIQLGDVVMIDYKVRLEDSTIIDGNHLIRKKSIPYIVGFGLQPKGWDLALAQLKVGDFARIKIPSKLARGNKEIKNLVPKDADNYLTIRVLSKRTPNRIVDGTKVYLLEENKLVKEKFNETNSIVFHTTISTPSNPFYFNSYADGDPFQLKLEDNGIIPGLKKALINAKKGDRMYIYVPASEAYGAKGYFSLVKPNEPLFYNLLVMDILR